MLDPRIATVTRRRALALSGAAGLASLLGAPRGLRAAAAAGRASSFGMDVPAGAMDGATVISAPRSFDLVGVRGDGLAGAGLEVRVRRRGGAWSEWVAVGAGVDHAPDEPLHAPASDPVWAGGADELQMRSARRLGALRLKFVAVPPGAPVAHVRQLQAGAVTAGSAPAIIPRAQWGAGTAPPRAAPSYGAIELAFVHHTVNANDYTAADSARIVLGIAKYHIDHNGWNDIGYNFLVDKFGQVFEGRAGGVEQAVIGAQAGGWNSKSTGVALIGTFASAPVPEAAEAVLARLIAWKLSLHAVPLTGTVQLVSGGGTENRYAYGTKVTLNRVSGHRDGCKTDCPGNALYGRLGELRGRVAALQGAFAAGPRVTLAVASSSVFYDDAARCSGRVAQPDGTPVSGVAVAVQKLGANGRWLVVARARTASDGGWAVPVTWRKTGALRAVATLPDASTVRSAQVTVTVLSAIRVTKPAERSRILAGRTVKISGTVGPSGAVAIQLERQITGGKWVAAGRVRAVTKGHTFSAKIKLAKAGLYRLTARGGTKSQPSAAQPIFVRAVKNAANLRGLESDGGAAVPGGLPAQ